MSMELVYHKPYPTNNTDAISVYTVMENIEN